MSPRSRKLLREIALVLLSGALYTAAHPPFGLWPMAFLCLVPWAVAIEGASPLRAGFLTFLFGIPAFVGGLWWIAAVGIGGFFGLLFLAPVLSSLFWTLPGACVALWRSRMRLPLPAALAVSWAANDTIRTFLFGGFPWLFLAHPIAECPVLVRTAALGGAPLVGALVAAVNGVLAEAVLRAARSPLAPPPRALARSAAAVGAALLGSVVWGVASRRAEFPPGPTIGGVQGNVALLDKEGRKPASEREDQHVRLLLDSAGGGADLVGWAETMAPRSLGCEPDALSRMCAVARTLGEGGTPLLLGSDAGGVVERPPRRREWNSVFLIGPDGAPRQRYDKRRLVWPTEEVPLRGPFPVLERLVKEGAGWVPNLSRGERTALFRIPGARGKPDWDAGVLICYEIVFSDLARELRNAGATVILNPTNEAWFPGSSEFAQIWEAAVFRAVETRTSVVRIANSGWSGLIDPNGEARVMVGEDAGGPGGTTMRVTVPLDDRGTPYLALGEWFGNGAIGLGLLLVVWALRRIVTNGPRPPGAPAPPA
ncbi:MAG: apolipoprotein N-acyltransferase [Planctomycetales bacterium]|nr:apolipoprotein N-acyltransferase [Planctomycetales bacterium]